MIALIGHWLELGGWAVVALIAARLAFGLYRFARLPRPAKRNYPAALWAKVRWRWLVRNLNLAYLDSHRKAVRPVAFGTSVKVRPAADEVTRMRFPKAKIRADAFGLVATVKTIPKVGRLEFDREATHIANSWRCHRVQVSQPEPGRVVVRGLRVDPLVQPLPMDAVPAGIYDSNSVPNQLYIGRDEWGLDRYRPLRGLTGICVGGLPDYGKTSFILSLLAQLAPSECVQFAFIDGKGGLEYDDWRDRAWLHTGDDLPAAAGVFEDVHALMRSRFPVVLERTGYRNAWNRGPTPEFPLIVTVVDECHTFFDLDGVKGDREAERQVRACRMLAGQLVRKGRSVLMLTIFITQKQTSDAIPTNIRDNCGFGLAFALRTRDAAVASLGDHIREYPGYCPTGLQDPAYIGVATASLQTGMDPFTRIRIPEITEEAAAYRAYATAHLRADPTAQRIEQLPASEVPALALP